LTGHFSHIFIKRFLRAELYRVVMGRKSPSFGVDHPPTISAEVKEILGVKLYSPSGLSWPVLG
jgi:hypothetical protein